MNAFISARALSRRLGIAVMCAIALLALPAAAFAATFSAASPAPNSTVTLSPATVSVFAAAPAPIVGTPLLTVDGHAYPATLSYAVATPGYWAYDPDWDEDYWVAPVYDRTKGTVSSAPGALLDGSRVASVTLPGGAGSYSWSFTVAERPLIGAVAPLSGATVTTTSPAITVKATDNAAVATWTATIDNVAVPATYDVPTSTLRLDPGPLGNFASHTASVTVGDAAGNTSTKSWSFTVSAPVTTFTSQTPAQGSVLSAGPVQAKVDVACTSNLRSDSTLAVRVDGVLDPIAVLIRPYPSDLKRATVITYAAALKTDGAHTVSVTIANTGGTSATTSWGYTVGVAPTLGAPAPAAGTVVATTTPLIEIPASDNSAVTSWTASVNGAPAASTYTGGKVHVALSSALPNDAETTVKVTVFDAQGLSKSLTWKFEVQTYPDMPSTVNDCASCHPGYEDDEDMSPWCAQCHVLEPSHQGTPTQIHARADVSACKPCHVSSLTDEHFRRKDASGATLTCVTCHKSTDPKVVSAIASGDSSCSGCHAAGGHEEFHITDSGSCAGCHAGASLTTVHITGYGLTCETCHESTDTLVAAAIQNHDRACSACHINPDHEAIHTIARTDSCAGCHEGPSLTTVHANSSPTFTCATCHSSINPAVTGAIAAHDLNCATCHQPQHALDKSFCYQCHTSAMAAYPGKSLAETTDHMTATTSSLALTVYPGSGAPAASCYNCHASHDGQTRATGNALCYGCHDDAAVSPKPATYSYQGGSAYGSTPHASNPGSCASCHSVHGSRTAVADPMPAYLAASEESLCLGCHSSTSSSVSGVNIAAKFANPDRATHHDVRAADQAASGAKLACSSCHDPHADTSTVAYSDPTQIGKPGPSNTSDYVGSDGRVIVAVAAQHDGVSPVISGLNFDTTGANYTAPAVAWTTNEPATSWVEWGTTTAYGNSAGTDALVTNHSAKTGTLTAGTTYHWRICTRDAVGNTAYSSDQLYTPAAGGPPATPAQNAPVPLNATDYGTSSIQITLSCSPVTAPDGHAVQYQFYATGGFTGGDGYVGYFDGIYDSGWVNTPSFATWFMQAGPESGTAPISWKVRTRDKIDQALISNWSPSATFDVNCGSVYDFVLNTRPSATPFGTLALVQPRKASPLQGDGAGEQMLLAMADSPRIHYSANSDLMKLELTTYGGGATVLTPSSGWQSAAATITAVTPASPGAPVSAGVIANTVSANAAYWVTDLATTDKSYNVQVAAFQVSSAQRKGLRELRFTWTGHGEPTPGYGAAEFVWNYRTRSWETIRAQIAPIDVTVYRTVGTIADSMCLACHSGTSPSGVVVPPTLANIGAKWGATGDLHGGGAGAGFASSLVGYQRGESAVACSACHDPHGSNNLYGIPSQVNGVTGVSVTSKSTLRNLCSACHTGTVASWHQPCAECHAGGHWSGWVSPDPAQYTPTDSSDCTSCHGHGKGFQHNGGRSICETCHGVGELNALTGGQYSPVYENWPRAF